MSDNSGPDFVCIGAQKSGTTWLYENMVENPEVWLPPIKEFHYFNRVCINDKLLGNWSIPHPHGFERYASAVKSFDVDRLRWLYRYYELGMEKNWYLELFSDKYSHGKITGEMTPGYSTLDERGVKYASEVLNKDVQIIFIVRNPVIRSWSAAKMLLRGRGISIGDISTDEMTSLLSSPDITLCSEYSRIIPLWKQHFNNVHILSYNLLSRSPREFLSQVSGILNIRDSWNEILINKRVWADNNKTPMPNYVFQNLNNFYSDEIEKLYSILDHSEINDWKHELDLLRNSIHM
ncbi:MAG: sulfotransferase domain-containing protein [Gammaproteobacteria bacterium]|nr:sulfotransferase domain-containing protein [Gammaproteobacteria bacterium]